MLSSCPLEQSLELEGISYPQKLEDDVESQVLSLPPSGCPPPSSAPLAKKPFRLMRFLAVLLFLGMCLMAGYLIATRSPPESAGTTATNAAAAASQANGAGNSNAGGQGNGNGQGGARQRGCGADQKHKEKMDKMSPKHRDYEKLYLQNEKNQAQKTVEDRLKGQGNGNGNGNGNGGEDGGRRRLQQVTQLNVPVVFHVILSGGLSALASDNSNGDVGAMQAQIAVLNKDFADSFSGTTDIWASVRSVNPTRKWNFYLDSYRVVNAAMIPDQAYTQSPRVVGKLNIWIGAQIDAGDSLGYAYYIGSDKNLLEYDGVYLKYTTLPGGSLSPYNLGKTATHEVGHFFDLPHIWGDTNGAGCTNGNDGIADTPAQDDMNGGCAHANNIFCPGVTREMYENFMDYTDDACLYVWTKMQNEIMTNTWSTVAWAQTNGAASTSASPSRSRSITLPSASPSRSITLPSASTSSSPSRSITLPSASTSSSPSRSITLPSASASPSPSRSITLPSASSSPSRSITLPSASPSRSRSPTTAASSSPSSTTTASSSPSRSRSPTTAASSSPSSTTTASSSPSRSRSPTTASSLSPTISLTPSTSSSLSPTRSLTPSTSSSLSPTRSLTPSTSRSATAPSSSTGSRTSSASVTATPSKTPQSLTGRTGVLIYIKPDNYPLETTWSLTGPTAAPVASGGPLQSTAEQYKFLYLSPGQYKFRIDDTESDGICCTWGNGTYRLFVGPNEVANGGQFGAFETKTLQVPTNPFACSGKELWLVMRTDSYPEETSWAMTDAATNQQVMAVAENTVYVKADSVYVSQICAQPGRSYSLVMRDSWGDGLEQPDGRYQVVDVAQSTVLVTGGSFTSQETKVFSV